MSVQVLSFMVHGRNDSPESLEKCNWTNIAVLFALAMAEISGCFLRQIKFLAHDSDVTLDGIRMLVGET